MNKQAILIRVTDDIAKGLKIIANKEKWSINQVGEEAIKFYLKARRIIKE